MVVRGSRQLALYVSRAMDAAVKTRTIGLQPTGEILCGSEGRPSAEGPVDL